MNLKLVNVNGTSKIVFQVLAAAKSHNIPTETNINTLLVHLKKRGFKLNDEEFQRTFDELEEAGAGTFDMMETEKFIWQYNLKQISDAILNPTKNVQPASMVKQDAPKSPKRPTVSARRGVKGRPPGAKNKPKPAEKVYIRVPNEILICFTTKKGKMITLSLEDADALSKTVEQAKNSLAS